jgi:hypothetical protein
MAIRFVSRRSSSRPFPCRFVHFICSAFSTSDAALTSTSCLAHCDCPAAWSRPCTGPRFSLANRANCLSHSYAAHLLSGHLDQIDRVGEIPALWLQSSQIGGLLKLWRLAACKQKVSIRYTRVRSPAWSCRSGSVAVARTVAVLVAGGMVRTITAFGAREENCARPTFRVLSWQRFKRAARLAAKRFARRALGGNSGDSCAPPFVKWSRYE